MPNTNMKPIAPHLAGRTRRMMPLLAALVLAGCAVIPPAQPLPPARTAQQADFVAPGTAPWPEANWWQRFGDAQLNQLVTLALHNAPSLEVVRARIASANAYVDLTHAAHGPRLDLNAQVTRQRYTENSIYPPPLAGNIYNSGRVALDFNYDFDWWGKQKAALEAALGRRRAAEAEAAGAAQTLVAAVSQTYFQYQSIQARAGLAKQSELTRAELLKLQQQRVKAGLEAGETLEPLAADYKNARQQALALDSAQAEVLNQLRGLVGVPGEQFPQLAARPLPQVDVGLPANLPLNLVGRRADIAAARVQIYAASQEVKQAKAQFYPDINLVAFIGFDAIGLGKLFKGASQMMGVSPALSLPIFNNGALAANLRGSEAGAQLAIAQYNQTLQSAVQEVNDAALRLLGSIDEAKPLAGALAARQRDEGLLAKQVQAGLADGRSVLKARLAALALQDQQQQLNARAVTARVDLYKALGGGYRDDANAAPAATAAR